SFGEADYRYHGANRLGANALLACIFSGLVAGVEIPRYIENLSASFRETSSKKYEQAIQQEEDLKRDLLAANGPENIHQLHDEMADWMTRNVTVKRDNHDLSATLNKLKELRERSQHI